MEDFLIYLLKSVGLLTLFFLCYFLLLKRDTSFILNRKFLFGGILTSAILPAVYFTKTVYIDAVPDSAFVITEGMLPMAEAATAEPAFSLPEILFVIYILGVMVLFIRLIIQLFSLFRVLYNGRINRKGAIKYVETGRQIAPFSFLNFIVYNPLLHNEQELTHILKHEEVHVSQWHTVDVLLANLNLLYQWFNPFAWLYLKNLQQNLEFIADNEAVKAVPCKKEYQKALVKISVENFNLALTNNFYQSLIKKRILMLNNPSPSKNTSWKAALILPVLFAFLLLFNLRTEAQVREQQTTTTRASEADISFSINANTRQEQLDLYKKLAEKHNILLEFSNITYNEDTKLSAINVNYVDKNNNSTGTISKENPQGIDSFIFYFGPGNGTGFRTESSSSTRTAQYSLHQLEVDPLYIINGKNYNSAQLDGKAIKVEGEVAAVNPEEAMKKYGAEAKSGALIISGGTIIEDFQAELKKIDEENSAVINEYIKIEKGKKPAVIGLNNSPGTYKVIRESRPSRSGKVINLRNLDTDGKDPVYILNGKVVKDDDTILKLSPEDIDSIQVFNGKNAVRHYGKDAKDGAILIFTKTDSVRTSSATSLRRFGNNKVRVSTGPTFTKDRNISITSARTVKNDTTYTRDSSFVKFREFRVNKDSVDIIATQHGTRSFPQQQVILSNQGSEPLYVINGKKMTESFDLKTISPEDISAINVLRNEAATRMYGEKAKHGVIEITTKNAEKDLLSRNNDLGIVKPSTTDGELEGIKTRLKDAGVNVKFEKIKRNSDGLITSIKISARTSNQNGSATFEVNDGIPPVYVGLINDRLVVSSNPPH